jgi:mono/diheme cytochrome c family protein
MKGVQTGVAALLLLAAAGEARAAGEVEQGRKVAETWCGRCHVIGLERPFGGIDSTPTFFLMSEKIENYRQRVLTLKQRRPHKALELDELSSADLEDVLAYIGSLDRP